MSVTGISIKGRHRAALFGVLALAAMPGTALARQPEMIVRADTDLRYGSFAVFGRGTLTVKASGAVINGGVFQVGRDPLGPAAFTVAYDRGNEGRKSLNVVFQVQLLQPPPVMVGGVSGTLSAFDTDIPGMGTIAPGDVITFTINNCTTRLCARSFRVGARLEVTRSHGGAALRIPVPVAATLVSVN